MKPLSNDHVNPQDYPSKDVYAVIGNPIAHSQSPLIHSHFAKQTQQAIHYGKIYAELNAFKTTVQEFFQHGGKGLNVTVPFKLEAFELAERKTERAQLAQAANVLWKKEGVLWCDNTDGLGLTRDLTRLLKQSGQFLKGSKVLLLGAGGAAQGVIQPLMAEGIAKLIISNRTHQKAEQLVLQFQASAQSAQIQLQAISLERLVQEADMQHSFDVIINATASGLGHDSPISIENLKLLSHSKTLAYDMVYGKETAFMRDAKELHLKVADGLGMLVEQAAAAFEIWRNLDSTVHLDIDGAMALVRQQMN